MEHKHLLLFFMIALTVIISNVSAEEKLKAEKNGPVAVISNSSFQAAPVIEGNDITHEFVIQNTGTEVLKISRVKTG